MRSSFRIIGTAVILSAILIASVLMISDHYDIIGTDVAFEEIDQGLYNGLTTRITYVINENESWYDLWKRMHNRSSSVPKLPSVNFTTNMVIAVFQGQCATSGYKTTITKILLTPVNYVVYIDEIHPGPNSINLQVITHPYHVVKISSNSSDFPVQFVYNIMFSGS